jgi:adenine deaminase
MKSNVFFGNIVDVISKHIFPGEIYVSNGRIKSIIQNHKKYDCFILPGFIDAHVHIESSLILPSEFARIALKQGVTAAFCDPHEIANVCGVRGVKYMIEDANKTNFKFYFGAPSCVPATTNESSGATMDSKIIEKLFFTRKTHFLSEMMNFPGVLKGDEEVLKKLAIARKFKKKIDGHAPGLKGENLKKYIAAGIDTDHECSSLEEAREKIKNGMKVIIREGSAAKNLKELAPLIKEFPDMLMFCSDDCHADNLIEGYLNKVISRLIKEKYELFDVLRIASLNPAKHYNIEFGLLQQGDLADFIFVNDLENFNVNSVVINGSFINNNIDNELSKKTINNFSRTKIKIDDLKIYKANNYINVIEVVDKELITNHKIIEVINNESEVKSNVSNDLLKIVSISRYSNTKTTVGFAKGFGLKKGAFASSISHDSHNIIAVGCDDDNLLSAINDIICAKGGISFRNKNERIFLSLPVAGLMSIESAEYVAEKYKVIENKIKKNGSMLSSPLMTLSFLSLLVIPELKISDRGIFKFSSFSYIDLFCSNEKK